MEELPLIPDQRRQKILRLLARHEVLSVHQLTEMLGVSHMTVRRDIGELEREGSASVVPGGVRYARAVSSEPSFDAKSLIDGPQKSAIAQGAAGLLHDGGVFYLDAGTTTAALVPTLRELHGVTVVTNDFSIVTSLVDDTGVEVVHVGGRLDHANRSSVGSLAASVLRQLAVDVAFVSASSWDLARGVTTPSHEKIDVKTAAMEVATTSVLLAASSKYGSYSMYRVAPLESLQTIVTDDALPEIAADGIRAAGIDLVLGDAAGE